MKGLLIKEAYMIIKYGRAFLMMILIFAGVSAFQSADEGGGIIFAVYPCLLGGLIPMTLISYDEREKWLEYSFTFPYTRKQMVSSKYITGLVCGMLSVLIITVLNAAAGASNLLSLVSMLVSISVISPSILLPFVFKFGAEKGRIFYYFIVGAVAGLSVICMNSNIRLINTDMASSDSALVPVISLVVSAVVFAASWLLSIKFFSKREI